MNLDQCVERALKHLDSAARERFALDPLGVLRGDLKFKVEAVDHLSNQRDDGGFCDGVSFIEDGVILFAHTPNSRRENFTLGHELGHWLVEQDDRIIDWLANQSQPRVMLETVCDRIAQRLLLTNDQIDNVLHEEVLRARHVSALFDATNASWQVCAIGLSRRIRKLGAVVLINRWDDSVQHASIQPDPEDGWPTVFPWRGQVLEEGHALANLKEGQTLTRCVWWRAPWGTQAEFFVDAFADDKRIVAVFAGEDVWRVEPGRIIEPRDYDKRPNLKIYCCQGEQWLRGFPCPTCHEPFCPKCGDCRCMRQAKRNGKCQNCSTVVLPHLLENGLCEMCR